MPLLMDRPQLQFQHSDLVFIMSILNMIGAVERNLDAYFNEDAEPKHYMRTKQEYCSMLLSDILKPRNIYNKELVSLVKHLPVGAVIAGSYVASILNPEHKPKDIDIFFTDGLAYLDTYNLFVNPPKEDDAWVFRGYKPSVSLEELENSSKIIRLVNMKHDDPSRLPVQLIKMIWYDSPEHVIDSFDFTVTQFCVHAGILTFNPASLVDIFRNNLIVHRHQFPMDTLYRLVKYSKKGYNISPNTLQKLVEDIRAAEELDPPLPFTMY